MWATVTINLKSHTFKVSTATLHDPKGNKYKEEPVLLYIIRENFIPLRLPKILLLKTSRDEQEDQSSITTAEHATPEV